MELWLAGLIGGLAGTIAMTMLMMPMMKGQPSGTQMLLAKITKKDPMAKALMMPGMVMHFGYGTFWGVALGVAAATLDWAPGSLWLYGLGLGVLLLIVMMVVWMPIIGMRPPAEGKGKMMMGMLVAHLVYGGVTGLVAGLLA